MNTQSDLRTISTLLGDALSQFAKLFQNEIDLAKAELSDRAQKITGAAGLLAGGALLVIPAECDRVPVACRTESESHLPL